MDASICFYFPESSPVNTWHLESSPRPAVENPAADLSAPLDTQDERNTL